MCIMQEPYMSHSLVRTSPFYTSPFWRLPAYQDIEWRHRGLVGTCAFRTIISTTDRDTFEKSLDTPPIIQSSQMWVRPQLPFARSPRPPITTGGEAAALPSLSSPRLFPPAHWLLLQCSGRGRPRLVWGRGPGARRG